MGFRKDAYATVWDVEALSDTHTKVRLSVSRKNKTTGEYETDFSGFVSFIGTATAKKAAQLSERDRIRLGDVDVTTRYDKDKGVAYTNYKAFSFETQEEQSAKDGNALTPDKPVDDGEVDDSDLPF